MNFTVQNSNISLHYNTLEDLDVIKVEDTAYCAPNDSVVQNVFFNNNTVSFDVAKSGIYNDLKLNFLHIAPRSFNIHVDDNTFTAMNESYKPFLDVKFDNEGDLYVINNNVVNSSSHKYIYKVESDDHVVFKGNTFSNCTAYEYGFLSVDLSPLIEIDSLTITGSSHGGSYVEGTLIHLSTEKTKDMILTNLYFHENKAESSILEITKNVGNLTFTDSKFENELLHSNTKYIVIGNPFNIIMNNITMKSITDDRTNTYETPLLDIESFDVETEGNFSITNIEVENSTVMFLHLHTFSGSAPSKQKVTFDNITVFNAYYETYNDVVTFGPLYSLEDVEIHLAHCSFKDLVFKNMANLIHMKQQTLDPLIVEHCIFSNITGGRILVEPLTISNTSIYSQMEMYNVTVSNCDFKESTFVILKEH